MLYKQWLRINIIHNPGSNKRGKDLPLVIESSKKEKNNFASFLFCDELRFLTQYLVTLFYIGAINRKHFV